METQSNRQDVARLVYENEFFMEPRLQQVLVAKQQVSVSVYKYKFRRLNKRYCLRFLSILLPKQGPKSYNISTEASVEWD